jgi:hypothetical protein
MRQHQAKASLFASDWQQITYHSEMNKTFNSSSTRVACNPKKVLTRLEVRVAEVGLEEVEAAPFAAMARAASSFSVTFFANKVYRASRSISSK